jgi:hypothetical protein
MFLYSTVDAGQTTGPLPTAGQRPSHAGIGASGDDPDAFDDRDTLFAGTSRKGDGEWTNGELYLMTFHVASDGEVHRYDAFLESKDDGAVK